MRASYIDTLERVSISFIDDGLHGFNRSVRQCLRLAERGSGGKIRRGVRPEEDDRAVQAMSCKYIRDTSKRSRSDLAWLPGRPGDCGIDFPASNLEIHWQ